MLAGIGAFTVVFSQEQQQANAFQYTCDSIIDRACIHHDNRYSAAERDKTPFILPFP